jgi:hypothetical protein
MGHSAESDTRAPLERHRSRRAQGVPTVTVFVGDPDAAQWIWEQWQHDSVTQAAVVRASSAIELFDAWLGGAAVRSDLELAMLQRTAELAGVTLGEFRSQVAGKTPRQLEDLVSRTSLEIGCPPALVWSALGCGSSEGDPWSIAIRKALPGSARAVAALLRSQLPAILVREPSPPTANWSSIAARSLLEIAEAVPEAELGLAFSERDRDDWSQVASDRERTLLREGEVWLRAAPARASQAETNSEQVIHYDPAAVARSRAERELFRQLEARPRTRGLFVLNKTLGECFGAAPIEIDLFSERLRMAIEVDGYHHFRDPVAYRRDRRKDLMLQELDFLVVRVLAADVTAELDYVLEVIERAVERRMEKNP